MSMPLPPKPSRTSANRAEICDYNFRVKVRSGELPAGRALTSLQAAGLSAAAYLEMFSSQLTSRQLDLVARILKARNESYYTIGSAGHEGNAAVGAATRYDDMAFLHYRSGAFFIQRAKQLPGQTPVWDMCLSLVASSEDPISGGRHKVFGSVPLFVPPQTSTIASHLPKAVGCAVSIRRAKDLGIASKLAADAIVVCSFGDASHNHATAQSAFNTASLLTHQNVPVPILFVCEDNGIGISVPTPADWIYMAGQAKPHIRYFYCDGGDLAGSYLVAQQAADYVRTTRKPAFLHMRTVRLLGHAGSDVEALYRSIDAIEAAEADDPLLHSARFVIEQGLMDGEAVARLYEEIGARCLKVAEVAKDRPKFLTRDEVRASVVPDPALARPLPPLAGAERRAKAFGHDQKYFDKPQHMAKLINWALTDIMLRYPETVLFGEDVAQKGGVYHVTTGLWQTFGARRVFNSPLDETSILGAAIGFAHNGFIPMPEIQFLAYVHNAEDQLRGEAATLSFFSSGQYTNGMLVRIAGLAYQKGFGGHFHNDNALAVFRDLPGVIVAVPARGDDAVRMLRAMVRAAAMGRVCVFIEPIALYMTKDLHQAGDGGWSFVYPSPEQEIELGEIGVHGDGDDLAIVTYGNGTYMAHQAEKILGSEHGLKCRVIDLRWIVPLPEEAIAKAVAGAHAVLIVDECRRSGSPSEAIVAALVERLPVLPPIKRITADDCFIPLGKAATAPLPSVAEIVAGALSLPRRGVLSRPKAKAERA